MVVIGSVIRNAGSRGRQVGEAGFVTDQGSWTPLPIEIDKGPDEKFRQGFIGENK